MAKGSKKIYLVETGPDQYREFDNWPQCQAFVKGKPLPFGSGFSRDEAMVKLARSRSYIQGGGGGYTGQSKAKKTRKPTGPKPVEGLTSDAGTHGNPGPCEFQVTDIHGNTIMHKHLGVHTNNYAELAGIAGMIQCAIERGETKLWTDSQIAMGWIKSGRLGPTVREPELIMGLIRDIQKQLAAHPQLKLLKWDTKGWGQIPSDFGRK